MTTRRSVRRTLSSALFGGAALVSVHCTFIADDDLKAGIGRPCTTSGDCQAAVCNQGRCTHPCTEDSQCVVPSRCILGACGMGCRDDAQCAPGEGCIENVCRPATRVAVLLPGELEGGDGWSTSHKDGLDAATTKHASALKFGSDRYLVRTSLRTADAIAKAIDELAPPPPLGQGAGVIITASEVGALEATKASQRYPATKFLAMGVDDNGAFPNVGAYHPRTEQGWYAAGRLAARVATSQRKCVGLVLPNASRQIVRETNAFARGARTQQSDVKVVIRWLGDERDPASGPSYSYKAQNFGFDSAKDGLLFREELLAAQLLDLGCTVVGHRTETQRVVAAVERRFKISVRNGALGQDVFSMGADIKDACRDTFKSDGTWIPSCLGVPYWNWGALYDKVFDEILRGVWSGATVIEPFRSDGEAAFKYELNPSPNITGIAKEDAQRYVVEAANLPGGAEGVFRGPYAFNGQRDLDRNGAPDAKQLVTASEGMLLEELGRTCWFVEGVFELANPNVVEFAELVPALVPYGPAVENQVSTLDESAPSQLKYGDVIQFLQGNGKDPTRQMNCTLH